MNNFAFLTSFIEKLKLKTFNKKKVFGWFIIAGLIIVVVFVYLTFGKFENKNTTKIESTFSLNEYSNAVEEKLKSMILKLDEINSASVMVMVESTPKIEYLTESEEVFENAEKGSSSTKSTTVVFEKNGSVNTPIVVTTLMPKVTGVLIVVNKISASTKIALINSISAVLNVDVSSINILQES